MGFCRKYKKDRNKDDMCFTHVESEYNEKMYKGECGVCRFYLGDEHVSKKEDGNEGVGEQE